MSNTALNDKEFAKGVWGATMLRGVVLVIFGFMAVIWPGITFYVLSLLFAIYVLVAGIMNLAGGISSLSKHKAWFLRSVLGLFELGIGVYLLRSDIVVKLATFIIFVGLVFLVQGIVELVEAIVDKDNGHRVLLGLTGVIGIIAGVILFRYPISSGLAFTWVIGIYGLIAGTMTVVLAFNLRHVAKYGTKKRK